MYDNGLSDNIFPTEISPAGKVSFNTSVKSDYSTNEAFKALRSNLLFCGKDIKTVLITSSRESEGKSTVSAELSKSLAEIDKKTLLIDADMRKSVTLRRNPKTQSILGLSELLSGQAELNRVIYNTQLPNFDVIFSGRFPPNPVELLSSDLFGELIKVFRTVYDYIIIDCPPLVPVIDASVISSHCDGAVLVISPGKTEIKEAVYAKEQLSKSNCKILGAVLNETDPKHRDRSKFYKGSAYYGSYAADGTRKPFFKKSKL